MLKEAKKLWKEGRLMRGESCSLPFPSKSIDIVAYITSLEFMPNIRAALLEADRIARKGVIIGLINKWSFSAIRRMLQRRLGRNQYYMNARFYSISDIKRVLAKSSGKLEIVYWKTTLFPRIFGNFESSIFPFGSFLGIAVRLNDTHD
jgi:ubiquinone/menaquinone biosynthesis C-methylase UbiE